MGRGISLHLGLNKVDPNHYGGWDGTLAACEADAQDMQNLAKSRGFQTDILLTDAVKRGEVQNRIAKCAESLKAGDTFFLTYSGHGGQVPDVNGDEPDHLDETWCLFDGELIDDELFLALGKFAAGVRVIVLSDSCHSGTVLKAAYYRGGIADMISAAAAPEKVVRAMPREIGLRTYRQNKEFYDKLQAKPGLREAEEGIKATALLISGCQDNQFSADGQFNGLFTGTLLSAWQNGEFLKHTHNSYKDLWKATMRQMPPDQTPNYYSVGPKNAAFEKSPAFMP